MKSTSIYINKKDIKMRFMVETMEYTDVNSFVKDTGVTVKNISFPIKGYFVRKEGCKCNFEILNMTI